MVEDREEDICSWGAGGQRSDDQRRAHGPKGARFNERGDDDFAQSSDPSSPQGDASVFGVEGRPGDDPEDE